MIKSYCALSSISNDYELFLDDIKSGINIPNSLLKHTVGFVSCHKDFVENGFYKQLQKDLGFDIIGQISKGESCYADQSLFGFSLTILTSDTATFTTSFTEPITDNLENAFKKSYSTIIKKHKIKPGMIILFAPFSSYSGDSYINTLDKISGGIPIFGSISLLEENSFSDPACIGCFYNDEYSIVKCAYITISDENFKPKFSYTSVDKSVTSGIPHKVTSVEGSIVHTIDDIPFPQFMNKYSKSIEDLKTTPYYLFLIQSLDNSMSYISRTLINSNFNGSGLFSGEFKKNDLLFLGYLTKDEVLSTTREVYSSAFNSNDPVNNSISFTCLTRNSVLGFEPFLEFDLVRTFLNNNVNYSSCCAGGEFCPLYNKNGEYINYYHNSSHIICVF